MKTEPEVAVDAEQAEAEQQAADAAYGTLVDELAGIVAGGEDEDFADEATRDRLIASKSKIILQKLRTLLPGRRLQIAHRWAGNFAETKDGLPIISEPDGLKHCLAVLGAGGNGITFSVMAAQIAAAWIRGRKTRGAKYFEPR